MTRLLTVALLAALVAGCGGTTTRMTNPPPRQLTPRDISSVRVLLLAPTEPYVEVAIIRSENVDYDLRLDDVLKEAAEIGCDAVLVRDQRGSYAATEMIASCLVFTLVGNGNKNDDHNPPLRS